MVSDQKLIRRALSAEVLIEGSEDLLAYTGSLSGVGTSEGATQGSEGALRVYLVPMVYPFESDVSNETLEDHIIESLESVKKFKVLLRGVTGYPGGFILLNLKSGNDKLILMHDLLHQGLLRPVHNPLFTYFPHVLLFRCATPEATRDAVVKGQTLQKSYEATVSAVRIEEVTDQGHMSLVSAIALE